MHWDRVVVDRRRQTDQVPWVDRYRPRTMGDIVGQSQIVSTVQRFIEQGNFPHLLFHGPPGCGKTTVSQCLVTELYGSVSPVVSMVLNASNERGIETVRNKIRAFAMSDARVLMPAEIRHYHKTVVLDEFDSMTTSAQNSMRQLMENCHTTRFILICNDLEKIDIAVQSRCAAFRFGRLRRDEARAMVHRVIREEGMALDPECIETVVQISAGDMRTVVNTLQQLYGLEGDITVERICRVTSHLSLLHSADLYHLLESSRHDFRTRVRRSLKLVERRAVVLSQTLLWMVEKVLDSQRAPEDKIRIVLLLSEVERALRSQIPTEAAIYTLASVF